MLAVLLVAAGLRLWDVAAQLPVLYHPDEPNNIRRIEAIVASGDLDPHFFRYPSLFLYLQGAASWDGPLLGWLVPGMSAVAPITTVTGTSYAPSMSTVLLHRGVSVACGVLLVAVVWALTRRVVGGRVAPTAAAALVALSPNLVEHSQLVTPDAPAVLLVCAAVLAAVQVLRRGTTPAYLVAGVLVGAAASCKYNAALVAVAVVVAFLVRPTGGARPVAFGRLLLAGVGAVVTFVATTPYSVIDREAFLAGVEFERAHYSTGHAGMEGDTFRFYAGLLLGEEWAITVPALVGIAVLLLRGSTAQRRIGVVVLAFPLVYGVFVSSIPVRNDRTIMVVLPLLAVLAGVAAQWAAERLRSRAPLLLVIAAAAAAVAAVAAELPSTARPGAVYVAREQASAWIAESVPAGSTILLESYSPWIDPGEHHLVPVPSLSTQPLPDGIDYVVASQAQFARFTDHPDEHPVEAAAYASLFAALDLVAEFSAGTESIRLYRVPARVGG